MPRALILDDDPSVRRMVQQALQRLGWAADAASSAEAAIASFSRRAYTLLVCDVNVGRDDGLWMARMLKQLQPTLKVVIMSGHPDNLERARAAGLTECLRKPFSLAQLQSAAGLPPRGANRE